MTNMLAATVAGLMLILLATVLLSYFVEALRAVPEQPAQLTWDPKIPIHYVQANDIRHRYIKVGEGPPLVLLHTLRTQLDFFQKVIPELSQHFTVYALDYPGHGFSDIPKVEYTPALFVRSVSKFLEALDIKDAIVVGESIGGTLSLVLAAKHNPRVKRAIAINPYDYDKGRGILRSSWIAKLIFGLNNVPSFGSTTWRLRSLIVFRMIMQGGVYRKDALPPALLQEMNEVGNRPHHYRAFMSLVRHFPEWEEARSEYGNVEIPVLLIYGDHDWSRPEERETNQKTIPGSEMTMIENAGHFLSLDVPDAAIQRILDFGAGGT